MHCVEELVVSFLKTTKQHSVELLMQAYVELLVKQLSNALRE